MASGEHTQYLLDDVEGKLQPLSLQHGDEVLEEDGQMFMAVSKWNQERHLQEQFESENPRERRIRMTSHWMLGPTFQRGLQSFGFQWPPKSMSKTLENFSSISSIGISVTFTSMRPSVERSRHAYMASAERSTAAFCRRLNRTLKREIWEEPSFAHRGGP